MKIVDAGGAAIPALGFGTWKLEGAQARDMVARALAEGWRHVDTARKYGNETEVGAAIAAAQIPRDQVFLTTKIWPDDHAPDAMRAAAEDSVRRLGTEPDLILLHWPSREIPVAEAVGALCRLADAGLCRHVGVSNHTVAQIETATETAAEAGLRLATNQVEFHPWLDQTRMLDLLALKGMALTAYLPLARGAAATDETLGRIGAAHGVSAATACLAWILARGAVAIPKTATPERLAENAAAQDVDLTEAEIAEISALARPDGRLVNMPELAPDWDD